MFKKNRCMLVETWSYFYQLEFIHVFAYVTQLYIYINVKLSSNIKT